MKSVLHGIWPLLALLLGSAALPFMVGAPPPPERVSFAGSVDVDMPLSAYVRSGDTLRFVAPDGVELGVKTSVDGTYREVGRELVLIPGPDERAAARMLSIPISLNWRHPYAGAPVAQVVHLAHADGERAWSGERMFTALFTSHGDLPVLSLSVANGALFDPDTGLMVVGNAIFHAPEKVLTTDSRDPRWWKYPGNFHMRGKAWERSGRLQMIAPDGTEMFQRRVGVRINGQMTRAFPQHSLRICFDPPLAYDVFSEERYKGYAGFVVSSAGNDQIKAMLRDAFQHGLCKGLPFEVSGSVTCVLYINGAYWGVHHIRHRMNEDEIARRHGISKKRITILEDEARYYHGDSADVLRFERLAWKTRDWDGRDEHWADTLRARIDVDGFLHYMATQMILGNMDWPAQNVRFWRYTGKPGSERPLDGRWYFIMGDSDLGYGVQAGPEQDMFERVKRVQVPITWLFNGMMRNSTLRGRFIGIARDLARGPFAAERSLHELDRFVARVSPEMERHTARWRRPADKETWVENIEVMRTFAAERERNVLERLERFERTGK